MPCFRPVYWQSVSPAFALGVSITTCLMRASSSLSDVLLCPKLRNTDSYLCGVFLKLVCLFSCQVFNLLNSISAWEVQTALCGVLSLISPTGYFPLAYWKRCFLPSQERIDLARSTEAHEGLLSKQKRVVSSEAFAIWGSTVLPLCCSFHMLCLSSCSQSPLFSTACNAQHKLRLQK